MLLPENATGASDPLVDAAKRVIEGRSRSIRARVLVDWNGNGNYDSLVGVLDSWVQSVSTERALKGSAPEEILLVEGSSAAEMSVVLSGNYQGMNLTSVFSRYNRLSPLYGRRTVGASIKYSLFVDTPLGEAEYPQFVGEIRTITPDRGENTVEITALDKVENLRRPVYLPQWAMYGLAASWGETDSQVAWSHGIIDLCLRNCDVSPSPKRPTTRTEMQVPDDSLDGVQFFLPGNGTYVPAVGWVDNPRAMAFPNRGKAMYEPNGAIHPDVEDEAIPPLGLKGVNPANFNPSLPGQNISPRYEGTLRYWCANRDRIPPNGTHWIGFRINDPQQAHDIGPSLLNQSNALFQVMVPNSRYLMVLLNSQGQIVVTRTNWISANQYESISSAPVTIPTNEGPVEVFVALDQTTQSGSKIYIKVGSNSNGGWQTFGSPPTPNANPYFGHTNILGRVQVGQLLDMSDIAYGARNLYNTSFSNQDNLWRTAGSAAVLDRGLNRLSHIPSNSTAEAWQVITDVAAAEFGSVMWDEKGVFRFWNQETLVSKQQTPVRTLTIDYAESLALTDTLDSVRNVFIIEAQKRRAVDTNSVYSSDDESEFETPARTTSRTTVWVEDVVSPLTFMLGRYGSQERPAGNTTQPAQFLDELSHGYVLQGYFPANYGGYGYPEGWFEWNAQIAPVDAVAYFNHEGQLVVRIWNGNNVPIRFSKGLVGNANDDAPALNIGGTRVEDYPSQKFTIRNQSSISRYGEKTLELSGEWYQDTYTTSNMIGTLMTRTADPIPVSDSITVPGDPRLQLGDTVILQDAEGFGIDIPAQIIGISRDFSDGGLKDTLTIEVLRPYDGGIPTEPPEGETIERVNLSTNPRLQNNENGWFSSRYESGRVTNVNYFPAAQTAYFATDEVITPRAAVEPGQVYSFSMYAFPSSTVDVTVNIDWYNNAQIEGQQYISSGGTRRMRLTAAQLARVSISATPPGKATHGVMTVRYDGDVHWSQMLVERSATADSYFDGDTNDDTSWTGEVGNSTSVWLVQGSGGDGGEIPDPELPEDGYTRRNLSTNPSMGADGDTFEEQRTGYYWPNVTVTRVNDMDEAPSPNGLKFSAGSTTEAITAPQTEAFAPGEPITVSVYVRNDGLETLDGHLELHCRGAGGAWIGATGGTDFSIVPGTTVRVSTSTTVPQGTESLNPALTETTRAFTMGSWLYEKTDVLRQYFDGDSEGNATTIYQWDAQPNYSTSKMVVGDGGNVDPGTPPPTNESGTAADEFGWGVPISWDDFEYTGQPKSEFWSVYGAGGSEPHEVGGADGKQCWPGHDDMGRRCIEQVSVNGEYMRVAILPNGDQGAVSHKLNQQYGRWEIRARVLPEQGSTGFPGHAVLIIWPESEEWPEDGEYDFLEVNVGDDRPASYIHYPHDPGPVQQEYAEYPTTLDMTQWHNYAIEWTEDHVKGFVDGVEWFSHSGGATSTRRDIQTMPSGHLTIQMDNFKSNEPWTGLQQGYLDVDWVRIYDMSGGGSVEPTEPPTAKGSWATGTMTSTSGASLSLPGLDVGDTVYAVVNTSGTPTVEGQGITFSQVVNTGSSGYSVAARLFRGVVTEAGNKIVTVGTDSSSGTCAAGAYAGDVRVASTAVNGDNGSYDLDLPSVAAPDNSEVLSSWSLVNVSSTWTGVINPPSGWTNKAFRRFDASSTRTGTLVASRSYTTGADTGVSTATYTGTLDGTAIGWSGIRAVLVNAS